MILKITPYFQAGKISPWGNHDGHASAVNENRRKPHLKSEKWIRAAPNFLSTIPPCSIGQQDRVQVQKIYRKKDNRCLLSSSIKRGNLLEVSRRSRAMTAYKCTKKSAVGAE